MLKLIKFHELASFRTKVISRRTFETSESFFSNLQNGDLPGSCTDGFNSAVATLEVNFKHFLCLRDRRKMSM